MVWKITAGVTWEKRRLSSNSAPRLDELIFWNYFSTLVDEVYLWPDCILWFWRHIYLQKPMNSFS